MKKPKVSSLTAWGSSTAAEGEPYGEKANADEDDRKKRDT
jgi:hypothetical protein